MGTRRFSTTSVVRRRVAPCGESLDPKTRTVLDSFWTPRVERRQGSSHLRHLQVSLLDFLHVSLVHVHHGTRELLYLQCESLKLFQFQDRL